MKRRYKHLQQIHSIFGHLCLDFLEVHEVQISNQGLEQYLLKYGLTHLLQQQKTEDMISLMVHLPFLVGFVKAHHSILEPLQILRCLGLEKMKEEYQYIATHLPPISVGDIDKSIQNIYLTQFFLEIGLLDVALKFCLWSCEVQESILGTDHTLSINSKVMLAAVYRHRSQYKKSEILYAQLYRQMLDNPETIDRSDNVLFDLAKLYMDMGRYQEAEHFFDQILGRLQNSEHVDEKRWEEVQGNLAVVYLYQEKNEVAEKILLEQIEHTDENDKEYMTILHNLAAVYTNTHQYEKGETILKEVVAARIKSYGKENLLTVQSFNNLANLYCNMKQYEMAEEIYLEIIKSSTYFFGTRHKRTLSQKHNLAELYYQWNRFQECKALYIEILQTEESVYGKYTDEVCTIKNHLGRLYKEQGRYEKSKEMFEFVLDTYIKKHSTEHPKVITSMTNLATVYRLLGEYTKAIDLFTQVIEQKVNQKEYKERVQIRYNIVHCLIPLGQNDNVLDQLEHILYEEIILYGEEHLELATTYWNVGKYSVMNGKIDSGLQYKYKCWDIEGRYYGFAHKVTLQTAIAIIKDCIAFSKTELCDLIIPKTSISLEESKDIDSIQDLVDQFMTFMKQ